ncbi:MAG TPA: hypothetical protein VLT57_11435, partial [Bryobacteraceae bacterium]|nr:hypothetical protein [Bryobacteraceae bacterium]
PGGSVSANFTITASAVSATTLVTISATYGGVTKAAALTVLPVALYTLSLSPSAIGGGLPVKNNRVSIGGLAPAGGIVVGLSSATPAVASTPASVTIPAGQAVSPVFTITTSPVATSKSVTITASYGGVVKTAALTVNPTSIYGVNLASSSIAAGAVSPGNAVVLNGTAASGGAAVQLSSSNPAAAVVPALVTVPAGGYMQTFTITAGAVATPTNVTITASWSGGVATANLIVNPTASGR